MKNRLSYTSVETYLDCPRKYYYNYIANLREEAVGSALIFGNAIDKALNAMILKKEDYKEVFEKSISKQEINGKEEDLSISTLVRYSKSDLTEEPTKEDLEFLNQKKNPGWVSLRRKGYLLLEAYEQQVLPKIKKVIDVQKFIYLNNDDGDQFIGFVDLICEWEDGRVIVFDHKTSSIKYPDDSVKNSKQLATYLIATGQTHTVSGYIVLNKKLNKREPRVKIQIIIDNVSEDVINSTFEDYDKVNHLIKRGEFPKNESACFKPWGVCQFSKFCKSGDMTGLIDVSKNKKDEK